MSSLSLSLSGLLTIVPHIGPASYLMPRSMSIDRNKGLIPAEVDERGESSRVASGKSWILSRAVRDGLAGPTLTFSSSLLPSSNPTENPGREAGGNFLVPTYAEKNWGGTGAVAEYGE